MGLWKAVGVTPAAATAARGRHQRSGPGRRRGRPGGEGGVRRRDRSRRQSMHDAPAGSTPTWDRSRYNGVPTTNTRTHRQRGCRREEGEGHSRCVGTGKTWEAARTGKAGTMEEERRQRFGMCAATYPDRALRVCPLKGARGACSSLNRCTHACHSEGAGSGPRGAPRGPAPGPHLGQLARGPRVPPDTLP